MAELRIQPKKSSPSPWLLVGLAALLLAAAAYFYLRPDPIDEPGPTPAATVARPTDSTSLPLDTTRVAPAADSTTTAQPATAPAAAGPTQQALLQLSPTLTQLADRPDLREDAAIREQRDNFTSATARLEDGDPRASLRPGLVAAANLLLAVQQRAYPNLEIEANTLLRQANQLSGRDATPTEQAQNRAYLAQAASLLNTMSYPAKDVL